MADELWRKSAHELARLIRDREVSSREVVSSHLARIEAVNPAVNAITVVLADSALRAADEADNNRRPVPCMAYRLRSRRTSIAWARPRPRGWPRWSMPCPLWTPRWWPG